MLETLHAGTKSERRCPQKTGREGKQDQKNKGQYTYQSEVVCFDDFLSVRNIDKDEQDEAVTTCNDKQIYVYSIL